MADHETQSLTRRYEIFNYTLCIAITTHTSTVESQQPFKLVHESLRLALSGTADAVPYRQVWEHEHVSTQVCCIKHVSQRQHEAERAPLGLI
jgi:hypothetical protein